MHACKLRYLIPVCFAIAVVIPAAMAIGAAMRECDAVLRLRKAGAEVVFDFEAAGQKRPAWLRDWGRSLLADCLFADVVGVHFDYQCPATDQSALPLAKLPTLQGVALDGAGITDETALWLAQMPTLRRLRLSYTSVT